MSTTHFDSQRGAVLVWGLLLTGLLGAGFIAYFHLGQIASHQLRQQYATDAAAYSGALSQSRALNLVSFVHRAQLAHQVAVAHLLTLASWHYAGLAEQGQLRKANPPPHLLALFFGPVAASAYQASASLNTRDQDLLLEALSAHQRHIQTSLVYMQQAVQADTQAERDLQIRAVFEANFPELTADDWHMDIDHDAWPQAWSTNPSSKPQPAVLQTLRQIQQLYDFLSSRTHQAQSLWVADSRCPWRRHELRQIGRTTLDEQGHWSAHDTQALHMVRSNRWIGCYSREYPMAWAWLPGSGQARFEGDYVPHPPENFADQSFWRWVANNTHWDLQAGTDNPLSNSWAQQAPLRWGSQAVPALLSLNTSLPISFRLRISTQARKGQRVYTRSAAESYFRIPGSDHDAATPHVFQPYWLARLSALALEELP